MKSLKLKVNWYHGLAYGSFDADSKLRTGNSTGISMTNRIQEFADRTYGIVSKESPYGTTVSADHFNTANAQSEIGFTVGLGRSVPINNPNASIDGFGKAGTHTGGGYNSNSVESGNGWTEARIQQQKDIETARIKASVDSAYNNSKVVPSVYNSTAEQNPTFTIAVEALGLSSDDKAELDDLGITQLTFQTSTLVNFARATERDALEAFAGKASVEAGAHTLTEDGHRLTTAYDVKHPGPYTTSFDVNFPFNPKELPTANGVASIFDVSECEAKAIIQMTKVNKLLADAAELHDHGSMPDFTEIEQAMEQDETDCLEGEKRKNYTSWRETVAAAIADMKAREPVMSKYQAYVQGGGTLSYEDWLSEQSANFGSADDKRSGTDWWKNFWGATKAVSSKVADTIKDWGPVDLAKSYAIVKGTNAITGNKTLMYLAVGAALLFLLRDKE